MKRAIFISIIFCASLGASAQCLFDRNLGWATFYNWPPFSNVNKAVSLNDGTWVLAGQFENCNENYLIRLDCNGDIIRTTSTQATWISDMTFYNGNIYVAGTGNCSCFIGDCLGPPCLLQNQIVYAAVYNTSGDLINSSSFDLYDEPYLPDSIIPQSDSSACIAGTYAFETCNPYPYHITVADTNQVLLSVGDILFMVNPNVTDSFGWKKIWQKQFNGKINDMTVELPYIYLSTDSGLIQIDTFCHVIGSNYSYIPATNSCKDLNGNLYFTGGNFLLHTDSMLNVVDSFKLSNKFSQWQGLGGTNDNVVITGKEITNDSLIMAIFDSVLSLQNEFNLTNQCSLPVDIATYDSIILLAGNDSLHIPDFPAFPYLPNIATTNIMYYKTYGLSGAESSGQAQAILLDAVTDSISYSSASASLYQYISLVLKNTGNDTIISFNLVDDVDAVNCASGPDVIQFNYPEIPPGDSLKVNSLVFNYSYPVVPDTLTIHFYLIGINGSRMAQSCTPVSIQSQPFIYDGVATLSTNPFKIFPNPTDGIVNIQSTPTVNSIFLLTDINGRILMEKNLTQPNEQLNISALAQGMYIYTIRNGNQLPVTGKLVKQ